MENGSLTKENKKSMFSMFISMLNMLNMFKLFKLKNIKHIKHALAFSLIELLISLIAISSVTAAFAPVISKKISGSVINVTGGSGSSGASRQCNATLSDDCIACDNTGNTCLMCAKRCPNGQYLDVGACQCSTCSNGYYCENNKQKPCPEGHACPNTSNVPSLCPIGTHIHFTDVGGRQVPTSCSNCQTSNGSFTHLSKRAGARECVPCAQLFGQGCATCSYGVGCTSLVNDGSFVVVGGRARSIYDSNSGIMRSIVDHLSHVNSSLATRLSNLRGGINDAFNHAEWRYQVNRGGIDDAYARAVDAQWRGAIPSLFALFASAP